VHVLLATDADWLVDEVVAALGGPDTSFTVCSDGRHVAGVVEAKAAAGEAVDIGIFDLQIGSMGGMAVTMALRLDATAGAVPDIPVLMLLDRIADVHLARRSGANGWLVKPIDPLRLRRAVKAVLAGQHYAEGLAGAPPLVSSAEPVAQVPGGDGASAAREPEPAPGAAADAEAASESPGAESVTSG
jgi:DNA-binding response OmpR family regulator